MPPAPAPTIPRRAADSMRPTASINCAMWLTAVSTALRDCGDLVDRGRGRRLHRFRGAGDIVIGGHHGLGGLLADGRTAPTASETRCATSCTLPATSASSTPRPPMRLDNWSTSRSLRRSGRRRRTSDFDLLCALIACKRCGSRPNAGRAHEREHRSRASSRYCHCPCREHSSGSDRRADSGRPQAPRNR